MNVFDYLIAELKNLTPFELELIHKGAGSELDNWKPSKTDRPIDTSQGTINPLEYKESIERN